MPLSTVVDVCLTSPLVAAAGGSYCTSLCAVLAGALLLFAGLGVAGGFLGGFGLELLADLLDHLLALSWVSPDLFDDGPGDGPVAAQR